MTYTIRRAEHMKTPSATQPNYTKINLLNPKITTCINVTDMTAGERRKLFANHINQDGFLGFIKSKEDTKTYYIFKYRDCI